jgi:hypothetical protein
MAGSRSSVQKGLGVLYFFGGVVKCQLSSLLSLESNGRTVRTSTAQGVCSLFEILMYLEMHKLQR